MPRTTKPSARRTTKKRTPKSKPGSVRDALREMPKAAEAGVKALIESSKPTIERAQAMVNETGKNLSRQSKAIQKDLSHRVADIGTRVEKERKSLGRKIEGAVKTTLASLNIPTRSEINLLARRVEELSRKIDGLKRK